jgi:polyhydroxybutyrate depolymerase
MRSIADSAGFILVYPQGLAERDSKDVSKTSGVWTYKDASSTTSVDNLGFVAAMIDKLASEYNIDEKRVYSCGYSNGGEFSFELACRLSNLIAAIGVVSRSMLFETYKNCSPTHPTAVLTIHGTNDKVDDYNGIIYQGITYFPSLDDVNNYWVSYNNTETTPAVVQMPDVNTSDGSTVERYVWSNGDGGVSVEHYKVIDGGHDWPGSFGNMDINSSLEIWNFVSKYDVNGLR